MLFPISTSESKLGTWLRIAKEANFEAKLFRSLESTEWYVMIIYSLKVSCRWVSMTNKVTGEKFIRRYRGSVSLTELQGLLESELKVVEVNKGQRKAIYQH